MPTESRSSAQSRVYTSGGSRRFSTLRSGFRHRTTGLSILAFALIASLHASAADALPAATEPTPAPTPIATDPQAELESATADALFGSPPVAPGVAEPTQNTTLELLGGTVKPGETARLYWSPSATFDGVSNPRSVIVANGIDPGLVFCLTGVLHGDEHNGLEIVRRVVFSLDPMRLAGAVIGIPIVNLDGFRRGVRYLPDRRDLNRYFPGRRTGSAASRIAHSLFNEVIRHCDLLVDIHTGSFHRTNLPQLRGDLTNLDVLDMSRRFGSTVILHNRGSNGTLRRAATEAGIPTVTLETGEPFRIQDKEVRQGVRAIQNAMTALAMYKHSQPWTDPPPVYYQSRWVRVDLGGVLLADVRLGALVATGDRLGTVTDPMTNEVREVVSPYNGRVLGMALNQVVLAGYAAFHIGIDAAAIDPLEGDDSPTEQPEQPAAPMPAEMPERDLENSE